MDAFFLKWKQKYQWSNYSCKLILNWTLTFFGTLIGLNSDFDLAILPYLKLNFSAECLKLEVEISVHNKNENERELKLPLKETFFLTSNKTLQIMNIKKIRFFKFKVGFSICYVNCSPLWKNREKTHTTW